jgi:hypothetical protein
MVAELDVGRQELRCVEEFEKGGRRLFERQADQAEKPFRRIRKLPRLFRARAWEKMWVGGWGVQLGLDCEWVCARQSDEAANSRFGAALPFSMQMPVQEVSLLDAI